MRYTLLLVCAMLGVAGAFASTDGLHGHRASFLFKNHDLMTLGYLTETEENMARTEALMAQNGDDTVYLYTRNDDTRTFGLHPVHPQPDWEQRIDRLTSKGFKSVLWLTPDDSPNVTRQSLEAHKAHYAEMVRRFDSRVAGYVIGLEVDEYWSAEQAQAMTAYLKSITGKPVGVHMTDGVGGLKGDTRYYAGADYIYLQTGFGVTPAQVAAMVAEAAKLGIPVIASEYHLDNDQAGALALGDAACSAGAVGTGNGRSIGVFCGAPSAGKNKQKWYEEHGEAIGLGAVVLAGGFIAYKLLTAEEPDEMLSRLNFNVVARDTDVMGVVEFEANERVSVGVQASDNRSMGFFNFRF